MGVRGGCMCVGGEGGLCVRDGKGGLCVGEAKRGCILVILMPFGVWRCVLGCVCACAAVRWWLCGHMWMLGFTPGPPPQSPLL